MENKTFTLTYGDRAENHAGMQVIGKMADNGFSKKDLVNAQRKMEKLGATCELIELHNGVERVENAYLLIIRQGVNYLLEKGYNADDLFEEHANLEKDTKALMRGRVVNKKARYNLCFSDFSQKAKVEEGKGTVIHFNDVKLTKVLRRELTKLVGCDDKMLHAEGNYYYDARICGIGYHGDSERKCVIGVRLGETMPLCYQWYHQCNPIGTRMKFDLKHGDIYIMSEKATGHDWKKRSMYTLRHAAGCEKYITSPKPEFDKKEFDKEAGLLADRIFRLLNDEKLA